MWCFNSEITLPGLSAVLLVSPEKHPGPLVYSWEYKSGMIRVQGGALNLIGQPQASACYPEL